MSSFRTTAAALFTIVALTFGPYAAQAQNYTWTPPTQAPIGGNVAAPVNVSAAAQTKLGPLTLKGAFSSDNSSYLSGDSVMQPDTNGFGFYANFLDSFFYSDVQIGDPTPMNGSGNEIPVDLGVYGRLKYQSADDGGNPEPTVPGHVLVVDGEGYARWADPATIGAGGGIQDGTTKGDTLYWDPANGGSWQIASDVQIHPNGPLLFKATGTNGAFQILNDGTVISNNTTNLSGTVRINVGVDDPVVGQVLKVADTTGAVAWGDTLPPGGNNGDVLTWNSVTNQWESTTINVTGGNVPPGTTLGDTLRWNGTAWERTALWQVGPQGMPNSVGTNGQTTAVRLATNFDPASFITLSSPNVRVFLTDDISQPGQILSATDTTGMLAWSDPSEVVTQSDVMPAGTDKYTMRYNGDTSLWEATDQILVDSNDGIISIGNESSTNDIFITNGHTGLGRFLSSADQSGRVKWNETLLYQDIPFGQNQFIDSITIPESTDPDRVSGFTNYGGFTYLHNDLDVGGSSNFAGPVRLTDDSPLTLEGGDLSVMGGGDIIVENLSNQVNLDELYQVCWNSQSGRMVKCSPVTESETGGPLVNGDTTVTFGPEDQNETIVFNESATLDLKWCGGGGGGGGGGVGQSGGYLDGDQQMGVGGGGGGGGEAGKCRTLTHTFSAGQTLSWNIGEGGAGGYGSCLGYEGSGTCPVLGVNGAPNIAGSGVTGGLTSLMINNSAFDAPALGGEGGKGGCSNFQLGQGGACNGYANGQAGAPDGPGAGNRGGLGGNTALTTDSNSLWWHNGSAGAQAQFPCGTESSEGGCGGIGGNGESPSAGNASLSTGSMRGGGGTDGNNGPAFFGKSGQPGHTANGGGGGGGSAGKFFNHGPYVLEPFIRGGNGGAGGDGYVQLTGPWVALNNINAPDEMVYATPGDYVFNAAQLPDDQEYVTIEVWGAGGGGGAVNYSPGAEGTIRGGGGAGGGYIKMRWHIPDAASLIENCITGSATNCPYVLVTVGAGGSLGVSAESMGSTVAATAGQESKVCITTTSICGTTQLRAGGGNGGGTNSYTGTPNGVGGTAVANNPGASGSQIQQQTSTLGNAGQSGASGGLGGAAITNAYGKGGNGASVVTQGGFSTPTSAQNGASGRVRISWD